MRTLSLFVVFSLVACTTKDDGPICNSGFVVNDAGNDCVPQGDAAFDAGDGGRDSGDGGDAGDIGMPDTPDGGGCSPVCASPTPFCDGASGDCVGCRNEADCGGDTPYCIASECAACRSAMDCDASAPACNAGVCAGCAGDDSLCTRFASTPLCATSGACVTCTEASDCTDVGMARCDATSNTCVPCSMDADCVGTGENVCNAGTCVECSEATAATHCGAFSCNPATRSCTTTERGLTATCGSCVSDTECVADHSCIAMQYLGVARGGYCLLELPGSGVCPRPYRSILNDRRSLSGGVEADYCAVDESATTCEAVVALGRECMAGCPEGGRCETVSGSGELCTYTCGSIVNCPMGAPLNTCNTLGGSYCGS